MSDVGMSEIIRASLEGVRSFADGDTAVGSIISTPSGVTVIPVSRISFGVATGGVDYTGAKSATRDNFGGGGGTGLSITPVAFLTVGRDSEINLIRLDENASSIGKIADLIEKAPDIIEKIKGSLG